MIVLVCGDREWTDREAIRRRLNILRSYHPDCMILHGDCRGADKIAGEEAAKMGLPVFACPAPWAFYGKNAGPIRNRWMLRLKPDLVWAFHDNLEAAKGTRDMVAAAGEVGVRVRHFTSEEAVV